MQTVQSDPVDEIVGIGRHEDAVTPGGTARVHVLPWLMVVLTVGVATRDDKIIFRLSGRSVEAFIDHRLLLQ